MPNWSIQPSYVNDYMASNVPLQNVSYVVPMTGAASVAATAAMQNNAFEMGKKSVENSVENTFQNTLQNSRIENQLQNIDYKMTQAMNMARYNVQQAENRAETVVSSVASGGMSIWFLVAAAIVLFVLFAFRR